MTTDPRAPLAPSPTTRTSHTLGGVAFESPQVRGALLLSLLDGTFATAMIALTETFGIAAAVSLHAPTMAIALLGSTPLLLGSLGQYFLPAVLDLRRARKTAVLIGVALQSALLFVCSLTGYLPAPWAPWAYVAAIALAGVSANVTTASWVSWMAELVPTRIRARHFAWRNRLFAFVNLSCALLTGVLAADYSAGNAPWRFFAIVFACAGLARALSFQMLKRQYEPPAEILTAPAAWKVQPSSDYRLFCWAHALVQGAAAMSGPFFGVWYLRDLHFSYLAIAIASSCTIVGSIVSLPVWSKLADHVGNRATLRLAGLLVGLAPLPYLFFTDQYAVWMLNLSSGVAWAGYNLVSFNHLLGASENKDRARLFAYAAVITGLVVFAMTLLGGILATRLPQWFAWRLQSLFLLSAVLRLMTFSWFFPRLHEYVPPTGVGAQDLFNEMPGYRVGLGLLRNFFRAFRGG